jgi:hypothetical protein
MPITINGSGTVTGLSAGGLPDGSITTDDIAANAVTAAKIGYAGAILQVVSTTKTDTFTTTATASSPAAVTGLSATITPSSTSSKILVLVNVGAVGNQTNDYSSYIYLAKGGTIITGARGDANGNRARCSAAVKLYATYHAAPANLSYLDSPSSTSSLTYQVYCSTQASSTATINRMGYDADNDGIPLAISTITAIEVAG